MSEAWLDPKGARTLCATIAAVQILIALANLAYIPSEAREYEAWRTHIESPHRSAPPVAPAAEPLSLRRELIRNVKQQLDLDRECNFTTWLSSMQSALIAFVTLMLAFQSRRRSWLLLMVGFLYLSMDELCQTHEWVGFLIARTGRLGVLEPPYPWVIVLGPVFLLYALGVARFLGRQLAGERGLRRRAVLALILMASSLPLEAIGGKLQGDAPRPPRLEVIAEESLETLGGSLFLYVLLTLLIARSGAAPAREPDRPLNSERR